MVKVLAVNNYPSLDRFQRLRNALASGGADVASASWRDLSPSSFNRFDGVVLSGSPDMLSEERTRTKFAREIQAIIEAKVPLLGVCFGFQMIGCAFGSKVVKNGPVIREYVDTSVLRPDLLFLGLPTTVKVFESHEEVVDRLPEGFVLLAKSRSSAVAAARHSRLHIRGVQFHPERSSREQPDGARVLGNFVASLR